MFNKLKYNYSSIFVRNLFWQFIANISQAFFGGVFVLCLAKFLGSSEFGFYSIITAYITTFSLFFEIRAQEIVVREFWHLTENDNLSDADLLHLFNIYIFDLISKLFSSLLVIIYWYTSKIFFESDYGINSDLLILIVLSIVLKAFFMVNYGILRVLGRSNLIAIVTTIEWASKLLCVIFLYIFFELNVFYVLHINILCTLLVSAILFYNVFIQLRNLNFAIIIFNITTEQFVRSFLKTRRIILSNIAWSSSDLMTKDFDVFLLSKFVNDQQVGHYKIAKTIIQLIWRMVDPFIIALNTEIQKFWGQNDIAKLKTFIFYMSVFMSFFSILMVFLLIVMSDNFLVLIFGHDYTEVVIIIKSMTPWIVLCAPFIWCGSLSIAIGHPEYSFYGSFMGLVIGIFSFYYFVSYYGVIGAAVAWNFTFIANYITTTSLAFLKFKKLSQ